MGRVPDGRGLVILVYQRCDVDASAFPRLSASPRTGRVPGICDNLHSTLNENPIPGGRAGHEPPPNDVR
jgi:hypothetical protein